MKATVMYSAGDVRVEDVPDPRLDRPTDALVRITTSCICGSDLHPYGSMAAADGPARMGHEFLGVVEEVGSEVSTVKPGDHVVAPFAYSDGTCAFCQEGLQTSCVHGGFWDEPGQQGGQAEAIRVPLADGTLAVLPTASDSALAPSLLTLSDVFGTGYHAAVRGGVTRGSTVAVVGDGAVGLLAVLSATLLGAERVVLMGRHRARTDLGREFGATDVVAERGEEGVERVRELTGGQGASVVLEAVGHRPAYEQSYGVVRPGGVISRVGVPQYEEAPIGFGSLFGSNVTLTGGPAPPVPTSRPCCRTCSTAPSNPDGSSTARSASTVYPTATARWPTARHSRSSSPPDRPERCATPIEETVPWTRSRPSI